MKTINLSKAAIINAEESKTKLESNTLSNKYAYAERRMLFGKRVVIAGFVIAILGVIVYCLACFNSDLNQQFGNMEHTSGLLASSLGTIGLGTLLWLIGSFIHLKAAMESDPEKSDFNP